MNNKDELIHREPLKNTPFELVGNTTHGYFVAMGKYRVSEIYHPEYEQSFQELGLKILDEEHWNILTNVMALFGEFATLDVLNKLQKTDEQEQNSL